MSNEINGNYPSYQLPQQPTVYRENQVGRVYQTSPIQLPQQFAPQPQPTAASGLLSQLANIYQQVSALSQITQGQYAMDRAAGTGILSGAANYSNTVMSAYNGMMAERQFPQMAQLAGSPISFEQLGSLAQSYALNKGELALAQALGDKLGVALPDLSSESLLNAGADLLGFGTKEGATAIASTSAEGAGAVEAGIGTTAGKVLGGIGAAYSAYSLIKNWGKNDPLSGALQGATTGAYIGSFAGAPGALIGGAIGGVIGLCSGLFGGGKSKEQKLRDSFRDNLAQAQVLDKDHCVTLADGSKYSVGFDGHHEYTNLDGTKRRAYEVDFTNPMAGQVVGWINPVVEALAGGNQMLKEAFTGYFTNAALSNATSLEEARQNVASIFSGMQISSQDIVGALSGMAQQGQISGDTFNAYLNGLNTLAQPASTDKMLETPPITEQVNGKAV